MTSGVGLWLWLTYITVVGLCVGSFINVVVARLPEGVSIRHPRSRCPTCRTPIAWYHNVPVLAWLWLRGTCRACGAPIAARYPLVELCMGLLWLAFGLQLGWSWQLALWLPLSAAFLAIAFLDIDHWWVPDVITYPAMLFALACAWLPGGLSPLEALAGAVPAALLWAFAWGFERITQREGLGLGDVKLLLVMGLALGLVPGLVALFLGAVQGSVVGVAVMLTGGHKGVEPTQAPDDDWTPPPRAIPFGPFLVLGALEVALFPHVLGNLPTLLASLVLGPVP